MITLISSKAKKKHKWECGQGDLIKRIDLLKIKYEINHRNYKYVEVTDWKRIGKVLRECKKQTRSLSKNKIFDIIRPWF